MAMALRPYQEEAMKAVFREWEDGHSRTLLVLPTGTGKTIVFSKIIEECVKRGERVLVMAHRGELLEQAADKLANATGLGCAVEKAQESCLGSFYRVVVGSVQTLMQPKRLSTFNENYFDTIIVDEAHHCAADSYQRILDHFGGAKVLGVTATPDRADMKNLGAIFDSLAFEYTLPKAIREGYLSKIKAQTIPLQLDLRSVSMQAGDFKTSELGSALDPYLEQIAEEMRTYCEGRKTVVFLPLVKTSQKFTELLNQKGFKAVEVNGSSDDRKQILADFDAGKYDILCNSMLLTEGWDCPSVDCIVVLRPTKSRSLYCQMVGRGTRLNPGKTHLLLLDFLWLINKHELCRPAYLISTDEDVIKIATEKLEKEDMPMDIEDVVEEAESDAVAQREEALARELEAMKRKKRALVDPLQFEMSILAKDLSDYKPNFGWECEEPSKKQKDALEKAGIFTDDIESAGKAALLLDKIQKRRIDGLTTPKQIRCLERYGFKHVGQWPFEEANKMIKMIAANGWRVPYHIKPATYVLEGQAYEV